MRYIILLILFALTSVSYAQSNNFFQVWRGTAEYRVEEIAIGEVVDDFIPLIWEGDEFVPDSTAYKQRLKKDSIKKALRKLKPIEVKIDTNFYPNYDLLELQRNGSLIYKTLGFAEKKSTWSKVSKHELILNFDQPLIARLDSLNHLSIVLFEEGTQQTQLLFEPISNSDSTLNTTYLNQELSTYEWIIPNTLDSTNTSPVSMTFQKDSLSIVFQEQSEQLYANRGRWHIEEFAGHYFIYVRPSYYAYYFHVISYHNSDQSRQLITDDYQLSGFPFNTKYPERIEVSFSANELPTITEHESLSNQLIGKWNAIDEPFPVDDSGITDPLNNRYLAYDFKRDGTVIVSFGGEKSTDYGSVPVHKSETRQWKLSDNGKFIIFDRGVVDELIGHISFFDQNTLEMSKRMRSITGHRIENMVFHLVKEY